MRSNITNGEVPFRKAYLRSLIDAVEVDQHVVRIHRSRTVLERAVLADRAPHPGVCDFVRKWRADQSETANTYVVEITLVQEPPGNG